MKNNIKDIPVIIMAGGQGTRMSNDPERVPKPLVRIGREPILWHIMKLYYSYGFHRFYICAGYKQGLIKQYFYNYPINNSKHITFYNSIYQNTDHKNYNESDENWSVTVVDTGQNTLTGGRLKKVFEHQFLDKDEVFCMTYGDSIGDINLDRLIEYHNSHEKIATITAVRPPEKYGILDIKDNGIVNTYEEKPDGLDRWVNGGFLVCEREVLDYIDGDVMFEQQPLRKLVEDDHLSAYHHHGFWHAMDTVKEHKELEDMWDKGEAPWKIWE